MPERILIVRLGAFGDVVRTLPAAWALRGRYRESHLSWLVEPASAPLLRRLPWLDEVIEFPRPRLSQALAAGRLGELLREARAVRRSLRDLDPSCVIDFHGILKSGVLSRWTGAGRRVGLAAPHAREGASFFYNERVALPPGPLPRWARNAALASHLGARVDGAPIPGLHPRRGSGAVTGPVVIHPGTSPGTPYKRYPIERFAAVARALAEETGAACRVTAGTDADELAQARRLVELAGDAAVLQETGHDVGALIEAIADARVFLGGDTGPLHLASLLGTPVVQILGPTHPVQNQPWSGTPWARAQLPLPCSPCRKGCAEAPCLGLLPVSDVLAAVRRVDVQVDRDAARSATSATQSDAAAHALEQSA